MAQPAIFLDRDGVINYNRADYVKSWSEFRFLPGALAALQRLAGLTWPIVVITNQSAVGRGIMLADTVDEIHRQMVAVIRDSGGRIDRIYYCPHHPTEGCACRKPAPGMLLQAKENLDLDLTGSFLLGDAASDIAVAQAAGCRPILVKTGRGPEQLAILEADGICGFEVATDLSTAVDQIFTVVGEPTNL